MTPTIILLFLLASLVCLLALALLLLQVRELRAALRRTHDELVALRARHAELEWRLTRPVPAPPDPPADQAGHDEGLRWEPRRGCRTMVPD
jgi:hypothetical protein